MNRKAQVTIFVIVGMMLLLSVTVILYMQQLAFQENLEDEARESIQDFVDVQSINHYVTSCLDKVATEGLVLLGEQGGVIYDYQGGLTNTTSPYFREGSLYLPHNFSEEILNASGEYEYVWHTRNLSYAIRSFNSCSLFQPGRPAILEILATSYYPVKEVYFSDYTSLYKNFQYGCFHELYNDEYMGISGFLGRNNIPRLCYYNGSNKKLANLSASNPCEYRHYDNKANPTSIQHQLETYIQNNIGVCVNFTPFTETYTAYNITVIDNVTVTSIIQKPKGILVRATYPFTISIGGKQPYVEKVDFHTTIQINIRQIYDYFFQTTINMVRDPFYNLIDDWDVQDVSLNRYYRSSFELSYERSPPYNYTNAYSYLDDVLTITDKASLLKGKPYAFSFAIKQRKPVLDYLHNPIQYGEFNGEPIDFQFYTNSTIRISPQAMDPDYDDLTFDYVGWKEDYDVWLNYSCCDDPSVVSSGCNLTNHILCQVNITTPRPEVWTSSPHFNSSVGYSEFDSNLSDIGYHEVNVVVTDEHGYRDFQTVRILIFDLPIANLTGYNLYSDILDSYASIEDIYILNGSNSTASIMAGTDISHYIFRDAVEGFHIFQENPILYLPNASHNFSDVTFGYFNYASLDSALRLEHELSLVVEQDSGGGLTIFSAPAFIDVNVSQCLPHGYASGRPIHGYIAPTINNFQDTQDYYWADGSLDDNYYNLPHVCCQPFDSTLSPGNLEGGKFYLNTQGCFSTTFTTCAPSNVANDYYAYLAGAYISDSNGLVVEVNETNYEGIFSTSFNDSLYGGSIVYPILESGDSKNDVFSVSYAQSCSGNRGNICSGKLNGTWSVQEICKDYNVSINQFARCQGPGYSGAPFVDRSCEGVDLTLTYPLNVHCQNFSSGDSFENDFLRVGFENSDYGNISAGNCAPAKTRFAQYPSSTKLYCDARCQDTTGDCGFEDIDECVCGDGSSVDGCNSIDANNFFNSSFGASDRFYCKTPLVACDEYCVVKSLDTAEGCYCATTTLSNMGYPDDNLIDAENQTFFPASGDYVVLSPATSRCCEHPSNPTIRVPGISGTVLGGGVCFRGSDYASDSIFENGDLLACDGNLLCCALGPTCSSSYSGSYPVSVFESKCGKTCGINRKWN